MHIVCLKADGGYGVLTLVGFQESQRSLGAVCSRPLPYYVGSADVDPMAGPAL